MSKVQASIEVPYAVSAAEALWYDLGRWPSFVDGFGSVASTAGDWPQTGARVLWDSTPGGRGRVVEQVESYEVRMRHVVHVEDEKMKGRQTLSFEPREGGARVTMALEYTLKSENPLMKLTDLVFVRRALRDSLSRTLRRYALELRDDHEPPL